VNTAKASALVLGSLVLGIAALCAQDGPPKAPIREVTDSYFGQTIVDPYRWLEDVKSPETTAWMKAQADYATSRLDRLPMRAALLKRFEELNDAGVRVAGIQRAGRFLFYYRQAPGESDRRVYVREGYRGAERVGRETPGRDHQWQAGAAAGRL
jgi:prolyl oligopeptidase